jgi:DNA-binding XRE family transcriptional regulator
VKAFIEGLPDTDAAAIAAAMKEVAMDGRSDSRGGETVAKDFLEEIVEERSRLNAEFPATVDAALKTRLLLRDLAERRRRSGLSQTVVAARMGTSQSALARLESGETDPRITTVERYARAIGAQLTLTRTR